MLKKEEKGFISNDMIERMIKIEQRSAPLSNKPVLYTETECYGSLLREERKSFERYLKKKNSKNHIFSFLALLVYVFFGAFYFKLTGNVIRENIGAGSFSLFGNFLTLLFFITTILLILSFASNKIKEKKFKKHFKTLNTMMLKRRLKDGRSYH